MDSSIAVSAKRYRYTGKERDEETGLDSMGVRYYAAWLGRWTSSDPIGIGDGVNRFAYVSGNPVGLRDPSGTQKEGGSMFDVFKDPEAQAAWRERQAAAAHDDKVLRGSIKMAVAQYDERLRAEDAHRVEQLEKMYEGRAYLAGRPESYFKPGGEGHQRVADFRDSLVHSLKLTEGQPLEDRVAALEALNARAVASIDWRADAATDIALVEAAMSTGLAVGARGLGVAPEPGTPAPLPAEAVGSTRPNGMGATVHGDVAAPSASGGRGSTSPGGSGNTVAEVAPAPARTEARFGNAATSDYKKTFFDANPELKGEVVVHHAVEQQVLKRHPGLVTESEMHSLENLRGVPKPINSAVHLSAIRKAWNRFYKSNPNPSLQDILDQATLIDDQFGHLFRPPVR